MSISAFQIEAAMSEAMQLMAELGDLDDTLKVDTLDGETRCMEVMDRIVDGVLADEALVEQGQARLKRIKTRADRGRDTLLRMMERLDLRKSERAMYTASIADGPRTAVITDATQLPSEYYREVIDKLKLTADLKKGPVAGAELSNGSQVLRLLKR